MCLGIFTKQAIDFAETKVDIKLIDGEEFVNMFLNHYEELDSKYKGMIPLKNVYIPQELDE